ncbi:MAG: type I restriction enzyme HsdR N-terminal domain-containing protein [Bacteroidales bacterium]|nr:type I restriction enzyme HsdR N-terminal domain-containing protein [Bacteroidales bacterium]
MTTVPAKVQSRLISGLKKFQSIVKAAKAKDINESDTVIIITDILAEIFGYDKFSEITSEQAVKKTFCDLAIKIDNKVRFIIEVKAAGLDLKEDHISQAVNYGANSGVEWIILTNGSVWKVFKIIFGKPISQELVYDFDFTQLNAKKASDIELLFYVCKESLGKSLLEDFHIQKQVLSRFFLGQLILTEPIIDSIRKLMKKVVPEVKVNCDEIKQVIELEVLKREVLEGKVSDEAKKKINKVLKSKPKDTAAKLGNHNSVCE